RLTHLAGRLEGASILAGGARTPEWHPTRLNARYHSALRLSELILSKIGLGTSEGSEPVASFVVDMAATFEDFVTTALTSSFSRVSNGRTEGQHPVFLDTAGRFPIRPDIVHL